MQWFTYVSPSSSGRMARWASLTCSNAFRGPGLPSGPILVPFPVPVPLLGPVPVPDPPAPATVPPLGLAESTPSFCWRSFCGRGEWAGLRLGLTARWGLWLPLWILCKNSNVTQSKNVFSDLSFYMIPLMWWITPPKTTPILPNVIIKDAPAYMY